MGRIAVAGAVGAGLLAGALGRNLPAVAVLRTLPGRRRESCGIEAAVDCAFRELPGRARGAGEVRPAGRGVDGALAVVGVVIAGIGVTRLRRGVLEEAPWVESPTAGGAGGGDAVALAMLGSGIPRSAGRAWLLVSFVVFLAG